MNFTVKKISDETTNGNNIIRFSREIEVDLGFAKKPKRETYFMAVKVGSHTLELDQEVDLPIGSKLKIVDRDILDEDGTVTATLSWLVLK